MPKSAKKRSPKSTAARATAAKPPQPANHRSREEERCGLKASSRHRDASIADRNDDRRDDEGNGLAAAFGARLPRRRGAQKAEAEAQFEEDRRQPGLPRRWRGQRQAKRPAIEAPPGLTEMPRVKVGPALPDGSTLDVEIARLRDLDVASLQARWHNVFRRRPSPHLPRHLLFRVLAYRLQADRLGDLDVESRRLLDGAGPPEDAGKRAVDSNRLTAELRPGTMLAREWNGRMHRVAVLADGFAWNGKTYPSLSKIALAITGTRWNGPRFFGLRDKPSKEARS